MNIKLILLVILILGGLLVIFYNYLYKSEHEYYNLISVNEENIDENYEKTHIINDILKRDELSSPGFGEGIVLKWDMYLPSVMGERNWHSSYSKDKPIIRIGNTPHVYYNPKYNTLKVIVKYNETGFYSHQPIIELKNIPLQRWNNFIVVINNNHVKIYLNGKQIINKELNNLIILELNDIIVGQLNNNINGKIRNFDIYFKPMTHYEIQSKLLRNTFF